MKAERYNKSVSINKIISDFMKEIKRISALDENSIILQTAEIDTLIKTLLEENKKLILLVKNIKELKNKTQNAIENNNFIELQNKIKTSTDKFNITIKNIEILTFLIITKLKLTKTAENTERPIGFI